MSLGAIFFLMEEFNYTPSLRTHFHVRRHFVRLPLCCHLSHGNRGFTKFDSATLFEISFLHFRNASLIHTTREITRVNAIELKLSLINT